MLREIKLGLIRLAKRIGRWLVRRLAKWVTNKLITYMESRLEDWAARKHPPKGRMRRWTDAVAWLKAQILKLNCIVPYEYDALANELEARGVPEVAAA